MQERACHRRRQEATQVQARYRRTPRDPPLPEEVLIEHSTKLQL